MPAPEEITNNDVKRPAPPSEETASSGSGQTDSLPLDAPFPSDTAAKKETFLHTKKGKIRVAFLGALIVTAFVIGLFIFRKSAIKSNGEKLHDSALSPTPAEESPISPAPTQEEVDISAYTIVILNGSGIAGEAARVKAALEQEGFTVVSIGNADQSDYENTMIQIKKDTPQAFMGMLKSVLEKTYVFGETEALSKQEESDVRIIIGRSKSEDSE